MDNKLKIFSCYISTLCIFTFQALMTSEEDIQCKALLKAKDNGLLEFSYELEGQWKGDFTFIQAADTQLGLEAQEKGIEPNNWDIEVRLSKLMVKQVNCLKPRPRFLVVCGDLVNAFPHEKDSNAQFQDFLKAFGELVPDIPLVCVCGNHDIGDVPTAATISKFTSRFGDDYFTFWVGGVRFIVLNTQLYKDPSKCDVLRQKKDQWLAEVLADPKNQEAKHLIVLQHIAWFAVSPDEKDEWFNIDKSVRLPLLDQLYTAGVRTVLAGHYHRNAGGTYTPTTPVCGDRAQDPLEVVVTSAVGYQFGKDHHGYRIVRVAESGVTHEYYNIEGSSSSKLVPLIVTVGSTLLISFAVAWLFPKFVFDYLIPGNFLHLYLS